MISIFSYLTRAYYSLLSFFYQQNLNIVVLGFPNSGKTSFINILTGNQFQIDTIPTIGIDFKYHRIENSILRIYDISGQERFQSTLWREYYQTEADILIYVIDLSDVLNLAQTRKKLIEVLLDTNDGNIPIMILGNKTDLLKESDFTNMAEDRVNEIPNNNLNNSNPSTASFEQINKVECFMNFLGLRQETQEKFVLKRKISNPNINETANDLETTGGAKKANKNNKKLIIEHNEEEIIEFYRDLGVFLVSCKEDNDITEPVGWLMGR